VAYANNSGVTRWSLDAVYPQAAKDFHVRLCPSIVAFHGFRRLSGQGSSGKRTRSRLTMVRPIKCRMIGVSPAATYFKPRGIAMFMLEEVSLELDELEALRLADFEALYQADAAERMGISRQTFANIVERARHKVADALIHGKALKISHDATPEESPIPKTQTSEE
jgi:uncharacterized protein